MKEIDQWPTVLILQGLLVILTAVDPDVRAERRWYVIPAVAAAPLLAVVRGVLQDVSWEGTRHVILFAQVVWLLVSRFRPARLFELNSEETAQLDRERRVKMETRTAQTQVGFLVIGIAGITAAYIWRPHFFT